MNLCDLGHRNRRSSPQRNSASHQSATDKTHLKGMMRKYFVPGFSFNLYKILFHYRNSETFI